MAVHSKASLRWRRASAPKPGRPDREDRRVDDQSVLLIEEQSEDARRHPARRHLRVVAVRDRRIEPAVDGVVVAEPAHGARGRDGEKAREGTDRPRTANRPAGENQAERRRQHRESRMEPRQQRREQPRERPPPSRSRSPVLKRRHHGERGHHDDSARAVGVDREREQQDRRRQRRRGPSEPGRRGVPRDHVRRAPGQPRGGRRRERHEDLHQAVAPEGEHRRDDGGDARQVNRVDLAVGRRA